MIVSLDDLKNYMSGVRFNPEQWKSGELIIAAVQNQLEEYLNRPVEPVLVQERVLARSDGSLRFGVTPVWQIISIIDPTGYSVPFDMNYGTNTTDPTVPALGANDFQTYASIGVTRQWDRLKGSYHAQIPIEPGSITVGFPGYYYALKYIGGLNIDDNSFIKQDIIRISAREMTLHHDDSISIKDGLMRDPQSPAQLIEGWTEAELAAHDRQRRRVVV